MTALYALATDNRLIGGTVQGYFEPREASWKEPIDRVIYGQLNEFGDAELAALIAPRPLTVVTQGGGAIDIDNVGAELKRARRFYMALGAPDQLAAIYAANSAELTSATALSSMLDRSMRVISRRLLTTRRRNRSWQRATSILKRSFGTCSGCVIKATRCERITGSGPHAAAGARGESNEVTSGVIGTDGSATGSEHSTASEDAAHWRDRQISDV